MQTFLPYNNFKLSARCLDNKRLGKQRFEAKQILQINLMISNPDRYIVCGAGHIHSAVFTANPSCGDSTIYIPFKEWKLSGVKIPWENHPAVLMWRGYELALADYGRQICKEWENRGFKDSLLAFFEEYVSDNLVDDYKYPDWYGNMRFHLSHQSNLLRKDWDHYIKWFGENIQDTTIPYYWPTKNKEK